MLCQKYNPTHPDIQTAARDPRRHPGAGLTLQAPMHLAKCPSKKRTCFARVLVHGLTHAQARTQTLAHAAALHLLPSQPLTKRKDMHSYSSPWKMYSRYDSTHPACPCSPWTSADPPITGTDGPACQPRADAASPCQGHGQQLLLAIAHVIPGRNLCQHSSTSTPHPQGTPSVLMNTWVSSEPCTAHVLPPLQQGTGGAENVCARELAILMRQARIYTAFPLSGPLWPGPAATGQHPSLDASVLSTF